LRIKEQETRLTLHEHDDDDLLFYLVLQHGLSYYRNNENLVIRMGIFVIYIQEYHLSVTVKYRNQVF
jgi:hypothetical protein